MSGTFPRLNGDMTQRGDGQGAIISIIGEMISCDGTQLILRAADGKELTFGIQPEFEFHQGRTVEVMGAVNDATGTLDAFVTRALGNDFDLGLYNDFLTKVMPSHAQYFQ